MREREAKSAARSRRSTGVEACEVPENAYPTTADALRDLARYLEGQGAQPDAALQMEDIMQGVNAVLDDKLLSSLEETLELALFREIDDHDQAFTLRLQPTYELLKKMRDLQKTRLRDAIGHAVRMGHS